MDEQQLTQQERKALKRADREERKDQETHRRWLKKMARSVLIWGCIAAAAVGIFWLVSRSGEPLGPDYSLAMAYEGAEHLPKGTKVSYNTNPPTSGNHWPIPLADGIYDSERPDEAAVHGLEHGRVWISYRPTLSLAVKEQLTKIAGRFPIVILTPRSANDADIALAAWQRLDKFNLNADGGFDANRVTSFIKRYQMQGPEQVPTGQHGGDRYETSSQ